MSSKTTINVKVEKEKSTQKPSVIILCSDKEISLDVERALSELDVSIVSDDGLTNESIYDSNIRVAIIDWRFIENLDYSVFRSLFPDTNVILILEKPFNELSFDTAASIYEKLKPSLTPHIPIDKSVLQDAVKYFLEKPGFIKKFKESI